MPEYTQGMPLGLGRATPEELLTYLVNPNHRISEDDRIINDTGYLVPPLDKRSFILVQNKAANPVYLNLHDAAAAPEGFMIAAGSTMIYNIAYFVPVFLITDTGLDTSVYILQMGV